MLLPDEPPLPAASLAAGLIDINGALTCFGNGTSATLPAPAIVTDTSATWNAVTIGTAGHVCAITDDLSMTW